LNLKGFSHPFWIITTICGCVSFLKSTFGGQIHPLSTHRGGPNENGPQE
jgi:hypothetical protein